MGMGTSAPADSYGRDSIEVLDAMEAIRRRPGMYVGDVRDGSGLHHVLRELVRRTVDLHVERRCFRVALALHESGAVVVEDDGPGLPVSLVPTADGASIAAAELLFTSLRVPKYRALPYANALSSRLLVESRTGGSLYRMELARGRVVSPLARVGAAGGKGTWLKWFPDPTVFAEPRFDASNVSEFLREITFLNPGLHAELVDRRPPGRREAFFSEGIAEWVTQLTDGVEAFPVHGPLHFRGRRGEVSVDVALRWTASDEIRVKGFANQDRVLEGKHLAGLFSALDSAEAPRRGLVAVVDVRGGALEIAGCLREQLRGDDVAAAVCAVVSKGLVDVRLAGRGSFTSMWRATAPSR